MEDKKMKEVVLEQVKKIMTKKWAFVQTLEDLDGDMKTASVTSYDTKEEAKAAFEKKYVADANHPNLIAKTFYTEDTAHRFAIMHGHLIYITYDVIAA